MLQSLGMAMVNDFNEAVFAGKARSDYADLNDLNRAAQTVIQMYDAAFVEHWRREDTATHRLLSCMARALNEETGRPGIHIDRLKKIMEENRLPLPDRQVFPVLERLEEEEFLIEDALNYRFGVPLYRRWIEWKWLPRKVAEEGTP